MPKYIGVGNKGSSGFRSKIVCSKSILPKLFSPTTVRKNCSSDREKLLKFEITRTIYSNSDRSEKNFGNRMIF